MNKEKLEAHLESIKSPGEMKASWKGVAETTHAFAQFLAELASEAEQWQRKLMRISWILLAVTIALFVLTVIQTAKLFGHP